MALGVYLLSFVLPNGVPAFVFAFDALMACLRRTPGSDTGGWLLALAWVANPAVWWAMLLLGSGERLGAAISGGIAIVLALCVVRVGYLFPSYYAWLASMVLVTYAALWVHAPGAGEAASSEP